MIAGVRVSPVAGSVAVLASAVAGYAYDGIPGVLLWGLAAVGSVQLIRWCYTAIHIHRAVRDVQETTAVVPPEIDAALRGLAHDLRSPIAAATAAFAAMEECESGRADDEAAFFRGTVRRNLEEAQQRLRTLEQHRWPAPPEARGRGMRAPLAGAGGRSRD